MTSLVQPAEPAQAASSTGQVKKDASMAGTFAIKNVLETNEEIDKLIASPPEGAKKYIQMMCWIDKEKNYTWDMDVLIMHK